jgi:hypothetical protein
MDKMQKLYYQGCKTSKGKYTGEPFAIEFYDYCNKLSKESIISFIEKMD